MSAEIEASVEGFEATLTEESPATIDYRKDTCAIIGTAHKGPAFVPKSFISMGEERPALFGGNLSTFARYFGDPTGSFNVTSNARLAADQWLTGLDKQVSFIRVLGAGDGKKTNSRGIVEKAGFVVGAEQVSGSSNHGKISSNVYANEGGPLGRTFFLGGFYYQSTGSIDNNVILHPLTESFEQFGMTSIDGVTNNLTEDANGRELYPIINGILMFPSGVYPGLNVVESNKTLDSNSIAKGFYGVGGDLGQHIGSGSLDEDGDRIFSLFLNGYNIFEDNKIIFNFNRNSDFYYKKVFNTDPLKIEEKGHLLYSAYDPSHAFHSGLKHLDSGYTTFILSSSLDRNTSDTSNPNFEDFRARYRTASTPWIVSQTFAIQDTSRVNLTKKVSDLFKFHSRADGSVGNKDVYTIIQPISLGKELKKNNSDSGNSYSYFRVLVVDYRSDVILEKFDNCNLDPYSKDYVAKKIGSQYEYYNWEVAVEKQKIVTKGKYPNQSQYIRIEMHEDVENRKMPSTIMPSGFRGYRHIMTEYDSNSLLSNISSFGSIDNSSFSNGVVQCPLPVTVQLSTQANDKFSPRIDDLQSRATSIENPTWGINARFNYRYRTNEDINVQLDRIVKPVGEDLLHFANVGGVSRSEKYFDFSMFLPDATQDGVAASWNEKSEDNNIDTDLYNNNLFHLEKIIVHTGSSDVEQDFINWNLATYRRDGKDLSTMQEETLMHSDYARYLNVNSDLKDYNVNPFEDLDPRKKLIAEYNSRHMAFSVYLAGGFDGTNIFDADKSNFTSDACVREENDELEDGDLDGPTIISYNKAANLIKDENLLLRDMVCLPGIESSVLRKNSATFASEEKTYLYIQDIPLSNYNYQIVTGSKSYYMTNFASDAGIDGVEDQDKTIIKATAESHRRNYYFSSYNASYFGETKTRLLEGAESISKVIPATVGALGVISRTEVGRSPSGQRIEVGSGLNLILNDLNDLGSNNTNELRELYRSRDINTIALSRDAIRVTSARTEDDVKPSLAGAIGTRRARSEIRKRIRDMSVREFLFENYTSRVEPFVAEYDRRLREILQEYVTLGVLESFTTNISSRNMSDEDLQSGIFRGSVSVVFVGRKDMGSGEEDTINLDDIVGTFERLVN
jgi:hypothetical protein